MMFYLKGQETGAQKDNEKFFSLKIFGNPNAVTFIKWEILASKHVWNNIGVRV